uniref:Late embryogenesis abundant protein LEA-2 subgroup domain-containing protein n=1 Tax=Aegilops tauschii subsp. strangulata TaxID=200361 RepID=A0A453DI27_AEGTS
EGERAADPGAGPGHLERPHLDAELGVELHLHLHRAARQLRPEVKPAFGGQQVLEGDVTQANLRTQLAGGAVEVEVKLNAKLRVKVWAFKVPGPRARISCPLSLPVPAAANAPAFKPTDCKVWF